MQPKTLSSFWKDHAESKGIDASTRDGKRITSRWKRWLAIAGDTRLSDNVVNHIHYGLDAYVANRVAEGVSGASIRGELNDIVACLRYASKRYRFSWVIERPDVPKSKPKQRIVMTRSEQLQLVDYCVSTSNSEASVATCLLLMLQGAMMPKQDYSVNITIEQPSGCNALNLPLKPRMGISTDYSNALSCGTSHEGGLVVTTNP